MYQQAQDATTGNATPQPVSAGDLRAAMSNFATGVAVITTCDTDGKPYGITANSFNSVSLDPPLVLWSLDMSAWCLPIFRRAKGFTVNLLSEDQKDICMLFASREEDRFGRIEWQPDPLGLPMIGGAVARFSCHHWARYPAGDHEIMIGEVMSCMQTETLPLIYSQGKLGAAELS